MPPDAINLAGSAILPFTDSFTDLKRRVEELRSATEGTQIGVAVICIEAQQRALVNFLAGFDRSIRLLSLSTDQKKSALYECLRHIRGQSVACIPPGGSARGFRWPAGSPHVRWLRPLIGDVCLPLETASAGPVGPIGWIASTAALHELPSFFQPTFWTFDELAQAFSKGCKAVRILSANIPGQSFGVDRGQPHNQRALQEIAKVLVVIPHYRCDKWLDQCLSSIVNQTRPPDGVVVVDDGSPEPPRDVVNQYPEVTLVSTDANVGPFQIIQSIIDATAYDAYMFQDADDWSMHDRLQLLLEAAEHAGPDLIGTQELRIFADRVPAAQVIAYPLDVNRALLHKPAHALQHPTSLVSGQFVRHMGGYASGLRFGGDTEFLLRAKFKGRIVNTRSVSYVRRMRSDSLTGSPETGFNSAARKNLFRDLKAKESRNRALLRSGCRPDLTPLAMGRRVTLRHIAGPRLRTAE